MRTTQVAIGLVCAGLSAACGPAEGDLGTGDDALSGDVDRDGIKDSLEKKLIDEYAPEVRLHPDDWTRPANVDWYLGKVSMRFTHDHCPDHQVLAEGKATQANLSRQKHPTDNFFCFHTGTVYASSDAHGEFFLQPSDDAVHDGLADPSEWRMYAHVKKSTLVAGGFDVQFWFFYAYDFFHYDLNHEADWEHITVTTTASGKLVSVWYAKHATGTRYQKSDLSWNGTHPIVYSAIGTHASYPKTGTWTTAYPTMKDETKDGGPVWRGWKNVVNVGEKAHPMNGQKFIQYGGRWGEIGALNGRVMGTTGPSTPSVQPAWESY
jgi:hypothetical protein